MRRTLHESFSIATNSALRHAAAAVMVAVVAATPAFAAAGAPQARQDDRAWYQRLTDGLAALVYWAAWPTATYERAAVHDIELAKDAAVVTFRLHGASAFAEGDLWVDVKMAIRSSGEITNLEWGKHNGVFPPGFTWERVGEAAAEINRRNGRTAAAAPAPAPAPAAPTPAAAVELSAMCLSNPTTYTLNYTMKWGSKSDSFTMKPGESRRFWARASADGFGISFDGDLTDGRRDVSYTLKGPTMRSEPAACTDDIAFQFVVDNTRVGVEPKAWSPGSSHPFMPNVVQSDTKGSWVCATGYKWAAPEDKSDLNCLDSRFGYIGVTLAMDTKNPYPRIAGVAAGGPAARAGVAAGMHIVSVDGTSLEGLNLDAVSARIKGAVGTTVRLALSGPGGLQMVTVERR